MEGTAIFQEFLNYLKFEKRFSEHTAKCYGADLTQFGEFLSWRSGDGPVAEVISPEQDEYGGSTAVATQTDVKVDRMVLKAQTDDLRAYLAFLNEKNYSKSTIARKLATLRSFYKFLVKRGRLDSNPVTTIRTPKQEKKLPRFLEYDQVKRLLETPPMDTWLGARDRAIMETLYSTGMRVSELVGLNMDDIDFLGEVVHIRGKGKKERMTPRSSS
jgi:integrase/recombinase XerC